MSRINRNTSVKQQPKAHRPTAATWPLVISGGAPESSRDPDGTGTLWFCELLARHRDRSRSAAPRPTSGTTRSGVLVVAGHALARRLDPRSAKPFKVQFIGGCQIRRPPPQRHLQRCPDISSGADLEVIVMRTASRHSVSLTTLLHRAGAPRRSAQQVVEAMQEEAS